MGAFDAYLRLEGSVAGAVRCDEPMAKHTTYRIGGPAALFVECASLSDLSLTIEVLAEEDIPWTVVGKGSNLLVADEGYPGAVLVLTGEFCQSDFGDYRLFDGPASEIPKLPPVIANAGGGLALSRFVQDAFGLGLSGLEFAVGTPGTVGGALFVNAGSRDAWMGSVVDSVTLYTPGIGLHMVAGSEIDWSYRSSGLSAQDVVVETRVRLVPKDRMMLHASMEASLKHRKASQPLGLPSCGSVFRNPEGDSAGRLIEACGLKGMAAGGAQISELHGNFIVNNGNATARDVLDLMGMIQDRVMEEHGVGLRPEVRFLGFSR